MDSSQGKKSERNLIKEKIDKYQIPQVRLPAIKKGEDFITPDGSIIKNEDITLPPREPLSYAYCSDTKYSDVWLLLLWE